MTTKDRSRPGEGGSEKTIATVDTIVEPTAADIEGACSVYIVLLVSPRGTFVKRPYMSLHFAQAGLRRAQDRGQEAHLVLAKLTPVAVADLVDLDGGDQR